MTPRLLVAALLAAAAAAATAPPARGLELGVVPDLNWGIPENEQRLVGSLLVELDVRWVRIHVSWRDFEQAKGVYNRWNLVHTGIAIDYARAAGAKVVLMVYEAPAWASGSPSSNVPRRPADMGDFMRFLAGYYRDKVDAYEIWNEPNYRRFWSTGPNPAAYARLLRASYRAVKQGDPTAKVVFGGLSLNDWPFLESAYRAGVKGSFDALATHPYTTCGAPPDRATRTAGGRLTRDSFLGYRELRRTMVRRGDRKPIWITEFGWSTATQRCRPGQGVYTAGVTPAQQARYLAQAVELLRRDPYVVVALAYNLRNNFWARDSDELEAQYGLLRTSYEQKPGYGAFRRLASRVNPPRPVRVAELNPAPRVRLVVPKAPTPRMHRLTLAARVSDDRRISHVEFYVGQRLVGADRDAPFAVTWQLPRRRSLLGYRITAVAYDVEERAASDTRRIRVMPAARGGP